MDGAALRRQFSDLGYVPTVMDRQAFGQFLERDTQQWREMISAAGIRAQ